jgi:Methyltransferase domain
MIMVLYRKSLYGRIVTRLRLLFTKERNWQDIEYFRENWKERIRYMSRFIEPGSFVMDLGCGKMWLREFLPSGTTYIPVDYCMRSPETIVADFNKSQFPQTDADIMFISGCLEYIDNPEWFIKQVTAHCRQKVLLSYCLLETHPGIKKRKELSWKNHLEADQIKGQFESAGFTLAHQGVHDDNTIFVFTQCQK